MDWTPDGYGFRSGRFCIYHVEDDRWNAERRTPRTTLVIATLVTLDEARRACEIAHEGERAESERWRAETIPPPRPVRPGTDR